MSNQFSIPALGAGVALHLLYFKRGEHSLYPFRYVQAVVLIATVGTVAQVHYGGRSITVAFRAMLALITNVLSGIFFSVFLYRLFFNPLNKFPGPFMARLTKFSTVFRNANMDSHHQLRKLHQRYGKYVRIGPNDLSVIDADGIQVISAPNSKCRKSSWYSNDAPLISLQTTRDRALHDRRKRMWSPAFSDKALRGYEERIQGYNDLLLTKLGEHEGQAINVSKWFNLYSFDVMGDLGFGRSFDMLNSGETHWAIKLLGLGMDPLGLGFPAWFFRLLVAIPPLTADFHKFIQFCSDRLDQRMKEHDKANPEKPDITNFLIDQYNQAENKKDLLPMMQGDSRLIIVAGSDTTAAALTHMFYWLAKKPELQKRLREELDKKLTGAELQNNDYLNGFIDETLRLNPPVPSGLFRDTPPEGVSIGKTYIPGNTQIQMPMYVMGHDSDCFVDPEAFIPERFYSRPELILHKDAWNPFSTGPYSCIGKNLAYLEIRTVTSQIIKKFNVRFAPDEDGENLLQKTRDHFTLGLADLNLIFDRRA